MSLKVNGVIPCHSNMKVPLVHSPGREYAPADRSFSTAMSAKRAAETTWLDPSDLSSRLQEKKVRKTVPGGSHWNFDASTAVNIPPDMPPLCPAQALHELVLFLDERRRVAETKIAEAAEVSKMVESVAMDQSCPKLAMLSMLCSMDL